MALWSDESSFPASSLSDAELLDVAISTCAMCIDMCTDMMLKAAPWSDVVALASRNFLVRCNVMHFQLRYSALERSEVWGIIVELRALSFDHVPLSMAEIRRAKAEQRDADDEIDVDDSGEEAEQRDADDRIVADDEVVDDGTGDEVHSVSSVSDIETYNSDF